MEELANLALPPEANYRIPISDLMKEAANIKAFRGTNDYDLSSFIREVEMILPLFRDNPAIQEYVFQRNVINKIQGAALQAIRTLGPHPTWERTKQELVKNFGVRETYHNLHYQAINTKNYYVSDYYEKLKCILDKLNTKYEFDLNKPIEFSPRINEGVILKIFINGINPNYSSIILSRNIQNLREAYYTLEETGMLRYEKRSNVFKTELQSRRSYDGQKFTQIREQSFRQPEKQDNNPFVSRQFNQPSGLSRQNRNHRTSSAYQHNNYNNNFRQYNRNSGQFRHNRVEDMEVDHIQAANSEEVNFQLVDKTLVYR